MEHLTSIAEVAGYVAFFLVMGLAIFSIVIGVPGCWIIFAETIVFALVTGGEHGIAHWDVLALFVMAGVGEVLEFLVTAYGAKKFGASNRAIIAALVGGLVGAIVVNFFFWLIGALIGAFAGVFLGAFLYTYLTERELGKAAKAGVGAFMGRMGAVLIKGTIAVAMTAVIVTQIFFSTAG